MADPIPGRQVASGGALDMGGPAGSAPLAVLPTDGSAPAHDVGPKVVDQNVDRAWSPDGTRILARIGDTKIVSIDPVAASYEEIGWSATVFPDWQRRAR